MRALPARALVFGTSAAVLVLEILAGRLLAPYVGVTLETFTAIIGTILAGISVGSWLGGRAADRLAPRRLLGPLLLAGGVLTLAAPSIVTLLGPALAGGEPVEIVILAIVGFFAPAAVLSAVNPVVVKLRLEDLDETGTVVGRLSALGTAGAIFGTFFTGFVLLASFPTRPIVFGVGAMLSLVGLGTWLRYARPSWPDVAAAAVVPLAASGILSVVAGPCEIETTYFCARVTVDAGHPTGRILWLDTLRHSYVDLDDPTFLEFRYSRIVADAVGAYTSGPIDALFIGGGGFTLPRWLTATRPGSTTTVLELDPSLVTIAEDRLGLTPGDVDTIVVGDARLTLDDLPRGTSDLVIGDAFGGLAVPWHLTTVEFYTAVAERMSADGIYVMNLIDYPPLGFARAEAATLRAVFSSVVVVAPPDYLAGTAGGNFVLVASEAELDPARLTAALARRRAVEVPLTGAALDDWIADAAPLTDDFAPVDQLITRP